MPGAPPEVIKKAGNEDCADCGARIPRWASVNLGILICETCAGIHRNLGTHITKVKSVKLDDWKPEIVAVAKAIGNALSNAYYEHDVPANTKYLTNMASTGGDKIDTKEARKLEKWIRDKYEHQKYAKPGIDPPMLRLERGESLEDVPAAPQGGNGHAQEAKVEKTSGTPATSSAEKHKHRHRHHHTPRTTPRTTTATPEEKENENHHHHHHRRRSHGSHSKSAKSSRRGSAHSATPPPGPPPAPQASPPQHFRGAEEAFSALGEWAADVGGKMRKDFSALGEWAADVGNGYTHAQGGFGEWDGQQIPLQGVGDAASPYSYSPPPSEAYEQQRGHLHGHPEHHGHPENHGMVAVRVKEFERRDHAHHEHHAHHSHQHGVQQSVATMKVGAAAPSHQLQGAAVGPFSLPEQAAAAGERRAALQTLAGLFAFPESFLPLPGGEKLLPLFGFDLQAAEFLPTALTKRSKNGEVVPGLGFGTSQSQSQSLNLGLAGGLSNAWDREIPTPPLAELNTTSVQGFDSGAWAGQFGGGSSLSKAVVAGVSEGMFSSFPAEPEQSLVSEPAAIQQASKEVQQLHEALRQMREEMASLQKGCKKAKEAQESLYEDAEDWWNQCPGQPDSDVYRSGVAGLPDQQNQQLQKMQQELLQQMQQLQQQLSHQQPHQNHQQPEQTPSALSVPAAATPAQLHNHSHHHQQQQFQQQSPTHHNHGSAHAQSQPWLDTMAQHTPITTMAQLPPLPLLVIGDGVDLAWAMPTSPPQEGVLDWAQGPAAAAVRHEVVSLGEPLPGQVWWIGEETFKGYWDIFLQTDQNQDGFVEGGEARKLFDNSGLSPVDLAHIWALADVGRDGRLSGAEFVCAVHLVELRRKGAELPPSLPQELSHSAEQLARQMESKQLASLWAPLPEELAGCYSVFDSAQRQHAEFIGSQEARLIMDRSGLPPAELAQIWHLADRGRGDGRLSRGEFACALFLLSKRRQGLELPSELPQQLQAVAGEGLLPTTANSGPSAAEGSSWQVTQEHMEQYSSIFQGLQKQDPQGELLGPLEAKELLERSGLPHEELSHIWRLSDVDGDGELAFVEFACAMHLVAKRRVGMELPEELPYELSQLVAGALEFLPQQVQVPRSPFFPAEHRQPLSPPPHEPALSAPPKCVDNLPSSGSSPWAISNDQMEQYRLLFESLERRDQAALDAGEAKEVLERSGLTREELSQIWRLSDVDQDSHLCLQEFACALHLASLRRQGLELPSELPAELVASLSAMPSASVPGNFLQPTHQEPLPSSSWALSQDDFERYQAIFGGLPGIQGSSSGLLAAEDAKEVLERSGLAREELSHIWRLSDLDGDGSLTLPEFVCAMHLIAGRRRGLQLPQSSLPPELLQSCQVAAAAAAANNNNNNHNNSSKNDNDNNNAAAAAAAVGSSWAVGPEELQAYREVFQGLEKLPDGSGNLGPEVARAVFERSGIPQEELSHIWHLADVDESGALSFQEFVCAIHLLSRRRAGSSLPATLPPELFRY